MLRPAVLSPLLVERFHIRADRQLHAVEDVVDRAAYLVADRRVLRLEVDEGDVLGLGRHGHLAAPSFANTFAVLHLSQRSSSSPRGPVAMRSRPHTQVQPICFAGLPTTSACAGTSCVTTAPAP